MPSKGSPGRSVIAAGQAFEARSKILEAEACYRRVTSDDPHYDLAIFRLGEIALRTQRFSEAERHFSYLQRRRSDDPEVLQRLGLIAQKGFRRTDAVRLYEKALKFKPDDPQILFRVGQCHFELWSNSKAIDCFRLALVNGAERSSVYTSLGVALARIGGYEEAVEALERSIALNASDLDVRIILASVLSLGGWLEESESVFDETFSLAAGSVQSLISIGTSCLRWGHVAQAEKAMRAAVALEPESGYTSAYLARLLRVAGRLEEASGILRSTINFHPQRATLYYEWAYCTHVKERDRPLIHAMESLSRAPKLEKSEMEQLSYALGKAFDDLGEYATALGHFDRANDAARSSLRPAREVRPRFTQSIDEVIDLFTPELFEHLGDAGSNSNLPIPIVGLPRSGTTLVEQILSCHPDVGAGGELPFFIDNAPSMLSDLPLNSSRLEEAALRYLDRLRFEAPGKLRVTDKMPLNIVFAGLIHVMFPSAQMICCQRDVLDNCLSMYVTPYDAPNQYMHSASNIAFLWNEHVRLVQHLERTIPERNFLLLDYEQLVTEPETSVRRLLEFLDLPWCEACLDPHLNKRIVRTPSQWQSRQSFYRGSVGRWKNYGPWIEELCRHIDHTDRVG